MCRTDFSKFGLAVLAAFVAGGAATASIVQAAEQDQPSVADAARANAAKKEKDKAAAPKTVVTEDSIGSGVLPTAKSGGSASGAAADGTDKFKSLDEAWGRLAVTEEALNQLEPLNKPELVNLVLQGDSANFAGRAEWEEKLFAAKTSYVQRSRQLVGATRQLLAEIADLQKQGQLTASDPHVQALAKKSKQLTQLASRTESEFQSVVNEGKNALLQASK
jgi:hypothetical protein